MPTIFRTKTISDILDPVAQQISKLLIYDEEAENGLPVQDLSKSVACVSSAVEKLLEVNLTLLVIGTETCQLIKEKKINQNLVSALNLVKVSCQELMTSCENSKPDSQRINTRSRLIESAKGILQGTSALLIALDDLEIEKVVAICRLVMNQLNAIEHQKNMDELLKFVQNLSQVLTKMAAAVTKRSENLTHKMHSNILLSCLDTVKALSPILVCGLKIHVQLLEQGSVNLREARENRDYMLQRVRNEINEIIRVVQLCLENDYQYTVQFGTETVDDFSVIQKSLKAIETLMPAFHSAARQMEDAENISKSLTCILENAEYIAYRSCIEDAEPIRRTCKKILELQKSLNMPNKSQNIKIVVESLQTELNSLFDPIDGSGLLKNSMLNVKKSRYSHSPYSNLDDSNIMVSSLEKPDFDKVVAVEDIKNITTESRQIVQQDMSGDQKYVTRLCDRIDYLTNNIDRLQKKTTDRRMQTIVSRSPRGHHSSMLISHVLSGGLCPFEFTRFYDICNNASSKDDQQKTLFRSKSTDLGSILSNGQFKTYSTTTFDVENAKIVPKNTNSLLTEFNPYKQTSGSNKLTIQIPKISDLASELKKRLTDLNGAMGKLLTDKVVENFEDIWTPVKSFVSTVRHSENEAKIVCDSLDSKLIFGEKSRFLRDHVTKCVQTARLVSRATSDTDKFFQTSKKLNDCTNDVQDSIGHLINIGKLLHSSPTEKYVDQLFQSVFQQFQHNFSSMRQCIDEVIDTTDFIRASGRYVEKCCNLCEIALQQKNMQIFVTNMAHIVKLCNRIVDKVNCELQNTDDQDYIRSVKSLVNQLQNAMLKSMQAAKRMALKFAENDVFEWNGQVKEILETIAQMQRHLLGIVSASESDTEATHQKTSKPVQTCTSQKMKRHHSFNNGKSVSIRRKSSDAEHISDTNARNLPEHKRGRHASLSLVDVREQFSCANHCQSDFDHNVDLKGDHSIAQNGNKGTILSHVTSSPNYSNLNGMNDDNEDLEAIWERVALPRQHKQIFEGARDLHSELTQWSTKHNDMVAAAIRVSILMAKLSRLVWCEIGTKKDLIACSKAVANASEEVTEIALQLAAFCPDLKIRKMLRQACEKVPTAATQLKILSTVKATMVDCPDRNEVEEAMQQLVFNAENLMKCVKNTVKVAETASLKIQTDTGLKLKWIPKSVAT